MPKSTLRGDRYDAKNRYSGSNCHDALHRRGGGDCGIRKELIEGRNARDARHTIDDGDWAAPLPAGICVFVSPPAAEKPATKAAPARKRSRSRPRHAGSRRSLAVPRSSSSTPAGPRTAASKPAPSGR